MIIRSRRRRPVRVPSITTKKQQSKDYEYVKGFNTNLSNDDVPPDQWRYITDAREIEVGKWETRKGNDLLSIPIGEAVDVEQTSTSGASTFAFNGTTRFAAKVVATTTKPLTALEARIRNANGATGTVVLALHEDSSGSPGTEIMRTTIANSAITGSFAYVKGRTITCPDIATGSTYWITGFVQDGGTGSYEISTTTNATNGKTSTTGGTSWVAASADFNVKLSTATAGGVKGCIRLRRPDGTPAVFFAHGTNLYSANESTGVTTSVDSGLHASSTRVRFAYVNDELHYVDGYQKPRKYTFTGSGAEVSTAPEAADNIIEHKGLLFFRSAVDPSKYFWTNFGLYTTYTSTDFQYAMAPKTGDPIMAFAKLLGNLYIINRKNKHQLFGAQNATFRLDEAIGRQGTFSQESVAYDENFIYLASDNGIYKNNGADEINIAEDVLDWWNAIDAKDNTVLELHNNRLYVFYTPNGQAGNTRCRVYNTLYRIWESEDLGTYVGSTYTRFDQDQTFVQGSNRVGMLMVGEEDNNEHTNMGEPLTFELRTRYEHYDAPAQFKRCPTFRPHFDTVSGSWTVHVGYATDYNDAATYTEIALSGSGARFDTGETFDSGVVFGGAQQVNPLDTSLAIPGEWRRLQIRYKHYAAREAVSFDGHVCAIEVQRMI